MRKTENKHNDATSCRPRQDKRITYFATKVFSPRLPPPIRGVIWTLLCVPIVFSESADNKTARVPSCIKLFILDIIYNMYLRPV